MQKLNTIDADSLKLAEDTLRKHGFVRTADGRWIPPEKPKQAWRTVFRRFCRRFGVLVIAVVAVAAGTLMASLGLYAASLQPGMVLQ